MADTAAESESLIPSNQPRAPPAESKLSAIVAVILCFGVGAFLAFIAGSNWDVVCDQDLKWYLMINGSTLALTALVFLALTLSASLYGMTATIITIGLLLTYLITGAVGLSYYTQSDDCADISPSLAKWTLASLVGYAISCGLLLSTGVGNFGGATFAVFGNLITALFVWIAGLFNGVSHAMADEPDSTKADKPPPRSIGKEFTLVVTHGAFMWFFLYLVWEAFLERKNECDGQLHRYLMVLGIYAAFLTYVDFLFEKFAGAGRRKMLEPFFPYLWVFNGILYFAWSLYGTVETFGSSTCHSTSKNVFHLSLLLSILFLFVSGMVVLGLLVMLGDYLCTGRVKVIMVIEGDISVKRDE
eukprot:c17572_g1_i1.p1 GENE.c17572_g1_i1~~c17572_g1_i1.p1  ORF type:complete len:358 (-),score=73.49 c17572_g1_i1:662-1735(-)